MDLTYERAMRDAEKINGYWAKRGIDAGAKVVKQKIVNGGKLWVVKSNLTGSENPLQGQ